MSDATPKAVKIVEVGPRDGLQNESAIVPLEVKLELIDRLGAAGLRVIEATSFVSPKWIPQMSDASALMQQLKPRHSVSYPVLVPNMQGFEAALKAGVKEIAVFAAASESFSQKNINCSIAESMARFEPIMIRARDMNIPVRGYISCVMGCPYEGEVSLAAVAHVAMQLDQMGCYEISLGDTIGSGNPILARQLIEKVGEQVPVERLAAHFHDTYGLALANITAVLQMGVATIDSAVAGLGGCPYAPGASGNVATEDVAYLLEKMGIETGVDLPALIEAGKFISRHLGREPRSKVARSLKDDGKL